MSTTTRSRQLQQALLTVVLGLVMAAGLWVVAEPELAWLGFAKAAVLPAPALGPRCTARLASRSRG
jgi:hypothetical protein